MAIDAWLPVGFRLPDDSKTRIARFEGRDWQVFETQGGGRALIVRDTLMRNWLDAGLVCEGIFHAVQFGDRQIWSISCGPSQVICPVNDAKSPDNKAEALAFALALKASRAIDAESAFQDALYVEKITRLLPTYGISSRTGDDVVLGYWLTGGASISITSYRRLGQIMSWLSTSHLRDVVQAAGFDVPDVISLQRKPSLPSENTEVATAEEKVEDTKLAAPGPKMVFELPGRPELAAFFNEYIVDIILHRERYKGLGIEFPSALILHGPPGCGKTFAVERLVEFLGWPSFQIEASSVASPYIHETSRKVAQIFKTAMENAPSVLVIDEMEAFLADREMGSGSSHHRVEEVAEFLRRIPEAVQAQVLIVAMTNRIDMIDPAIQRRGRFDHVIRVDFASEAEVHSLLDKLLSSLPKDLSVDTRPLAHELAGRPLSDVAFVVREAARLAARSGNERLDQVSLLSALHTAPPRGSESGEIKRRIGFI